MTARFPLVLNSGKVEQLQSGDTLSFAATIVSNTTLYVATTGNDTTGNGSSGSPWATVAKALSYLGDKWISSDATVTITLGDGTYSVASIITVDHPCGSRIVIAGTNTYSKTMSSVQSSSGSTGAWSVICNLNSVDNIAVNDYVIISAPSGGTYPTTIVGCHKVTNVDTGNVRITIALKSLYTSAPSGAVAATVVVCKAVLYFASGGGFEIKSTIGAINNVAIVGDYAGGSFGMYIKAGGLLAYVTKCGFSDWFIGVFCLSTGCATISGLAVSYCSLMGIYLAGSVNTAFTNSLLSGCADTALFTSGNNAVALDNTIVSGNAGGIKATGSSFMNAYAIVIKYNTGTGAMADAMSLIDAGSSTISDNGTDYSPAVNTQGNIYSYIKV